MSFDTETNILTIDVEEWYQVFYAESMIKRQDWVSMSQKSKIDRMLDVTLDILNERGLKATFFFVGWLAKYFPGIVNKVSSNGHEIASHTYWHKEIFKYSKNEFVEDLNMSKKILEDTIGKEVIGFRAPGFTIKRDQLWALDEIVKAGYKYDSSVTGPKGAPYEIRPGLLEFAPNGLKIFNRYFPINGGFIFRATPYALYRLYANSIMKRNDRLNFYIHSWELYTDYPRLNLGVKKQFVQYFNLKNTRKKLGMLLNDFRFTSIETVYNAMLMENR